MLQAAGHKGSRVAIVGAGFGGLRAARRLSQEGLDLTVIDRRNHHLFHPLLYQVATATLPVTEITYPLRPLFRKEPKTQVLLATATGIDLKARQILFRDGELSYDYLILATGSEGTYFGHDEWRAWAPTLKTIEDGVEMRRRILLAFEQAEREPEPEERKSLLTFVIVGGGSTGVELAGALADLSGRVMSKDFRSIRPRDTKIVLVEAGGRILAEFPERLSIRAEQSLTRRGVEVLKSSPVTTVLPDGVIIGDREIKSRTVLWTAGVAPSPLAQSLGTPLDRRGRVIVESDLSIPGHPEAFAVGDIASFTGDTGKPLPGVAPVAIQQGNHAARNIIALSRGGNSTAFHYRDKGNLVTLGRADAVARIGRTELHGFPAWAAWLAVHLAYLIGFRNRLFVLADWSWAYLIEHPESRLVLCDIDRHPDVAHRT